MRWVDIKRVGEDFNRSSYWVDDNDLIVAEIFSTNGHSWTAVQHQPSDHVFGKFITLEAAKRAVEEDA